MRSFQPATLALLIAMTAGSATAQQRPAAPAAASSPPEVTASLRATTMLVEDIDRTLDFYLRLGLTKIYDKTSAASDQGGVTGTGDLPLTADPTVGRTVTLRGIGGNITLLAYDRPKLASARGNLMGLGAGDILIVIEVSDIQEIYKRLAQVGTRFHRTPSRFTGVDVDGSAFAGQQMLAFDPDGHLVQVIQRGGR
jgi:catechol 2,3-dioxygenase-like lactoylglutathione lyase family enzyme